MAAALGFDAPAILMERPVPEEMLPLEDGDLVGDEEPVATDADTRHATEPGEPGEPGENDAPVDR
jgi:hypothetical protein